MTPEELVQHATRFVFGNRVVINLFRDLRDSDELWQVHEMHDWMKLGRKIGQRLTLDKAVELATKGAT